MRLLKRHAQIAAAAKRHVVIIPSSYNHHQLAETGVIQAN
jgi:hypothetical protein